MRRKRVTHFSHHHPLREITAQEEDYDTCAVCELGLAGPAYKCPETRCNYNMHKACFELPLKIRHKAHPAHPLTLLSAPNNDTFSFWCDACRETSSGFTYNCGTCDYDLHVNCVSLDQTVTREDHPHPISLCYSLVYDKQDMEIVCDVCDGTVQDGCWVYSCKECDFGTHLGCATTEKEDEEEGAEAEEEAEDEAEPEPEAEAEESGTSDPVSSMHALYMAQLTNQVRMQGMQFQINASRQSAQNMIDLTRGTRY